MPGGFHDLKLKVEFLAAEDIRQVELPKLPGEAKRGPALVKIGYPFETERVPEICKTDVSADRPQLYSCVKRKRRTLGHEAGE